MKQVVNQHFVPRCVLKYFKESNDVNNKKEKRLYHFLHRKKKVYPTTIDKAMSRDYYYEVDSLEENKVERFLNHFEDFFSKKLGMTIDSIVEYECKDTKYKDVETKCIDLLPQLLRMHLRSGALVYELGFWEKEYRQTRRIHRMLERFMDSQYINSFARTLINFHEFCILKSPEEDFLISDQFMSTAALSFKGRFMNATNRTVGQKDLIILLPLTKKYYMCFFNGCKPNYIKRNRMNTLKSDEVAEINKVIINNSYMETTGSNYSTVHNASLSFDEKSPTAVYTGGGSFTGGSELRKEVFFYKRDEEIFEFVTMPWKLNEYDSVEKNEDCPCGSGKRFGDCCRFKLLAFKRFMNDIEIESKNKNYNPYQIPDCYFAERNILDFYRAT